MNTSFWSFSFSPFAITTAVITLGCFVMLSLRLAKRQRRSRATTALEVLRILIILLFVVTLFRPERITVEQHDEPPHLAVLADASYSMETGDIVTDANQAIRRSAWVRSALDSNRWSAAAQDGTLSMEYFAPQPAATNIAAVRTHATDINTPLMNVATRHANLKAVVLMTDGDHNAGDPPSVAATLLRSRNVPVFTVQVGHEGHLPDLVLQSVRAPTYALVDEQIAIPFTIQSYLPRKVSTTVKVEGGSDQPQTKVVDIPAFGQIQESILLQPESEGEITYRLSFPAQADEVIADNNASEFRIALRREVLKVLVVDSLPRWEYRFLRNALSRDPGVDLHCILYHNGMATSPGGEYLDAFPETRDALSIYDVIFLGDVGIGTDGLPERAPKLIDGLVRRQGSGLVFLPGLQGNQQSFLDTPLEDLMPVEPDVARPEGYGSPLEAHLNLTSRGRDHLLTMLANTPDDNAAVWRELPGFYWHAAVKRAKPASTVLAVHDTARNASGRVPLLVSDIRGNGKVLFMGTDSAWRWRRGVEDTYHYRFWGQVVRWMAHQRHMAKREGIRFFYGPEHPSAGERVFLHATVFDQSGFPLDEGTAAVTIRNPLGEQERVQLEPDAEGWGVFTGHFTPALGGDYSLTIASPEADRRLETVILVKERRREQIGQPARPGPLVEIADITGGRYAMYSALDEVIASLGALPEPKPRETRLRLWCHPLWASLLIGLLTLYWGCRKLTGLL